MGGMVAMLALLCFRWDSSGLQLPFVHLSMVLVLALGIVLAGLVGSARLALGAHQPKELWQGYLIGFTAVGLALLLHPS
jgi:hypothetical protein